jgi:hypothetical protein
MPDISSAKLSNEQVFTHKASEIYRRFDDRDSLYHKKNLKTEPLWIGNP